MSIVKNKHIDGLMAIWVYICFRWILAVLSKATLTLPGQKGRQNMGNKVGLDGKVNLVLFSQHINDLMMFLDKDALDVSDTFACLSSDFQRYIHIGALAVDIVGIKNFFAPAFQDMTFPTQFAVVQAFPCFLYEF